MSIPPPTSTSGSSVMLRPVVVGGWRPVLAEFCWPSSPCRQSPAPSRLALVPEWRSSGATCLRTRRRRGLSAARFVWAAPSTWRSRLTLDYRSTTNEDGTARVRETPFQGSLLFLPGAAGVFAIPARRCGDLHAIDRPADDKGLTLSTAQERRWGWHLGLGAEFFVARHVALFGDYRFRFVTFGDPNPTSDAINIPGSGTIPGFDRVKLSHQGSMWAGGVTFYF